MREINQNFLEQYLDGELDSTESRILEEQLAGDAALAARVAALRSQRALRREAMETYQPTESEASALAKKMMEQFHLMEYAPLERLHAHEPALRWLKRSAVIAACLLIGVGSFLAGRQNARSGPIAGYTVHIQMPGGETISQTFRSYQQARRFVQIYQVDQQASAPTATPSTASFNTQGVF